jgi:hypothetical protein
VALTAALAAALAALTAALDEPGTDILDTVLQLAISARLAVPSYLGLSVIVTRDDPPTSFTTLEDDVDPGQIRASLRVALQGQHDDDNTTPNVALILYAESAGAFVDLAVDLAWLTGRPLIDFARDQHLAAAESDPVMHLHAASLIDQSIGVLIGRGHTPEQAHRELDALAATTSTDRRAAADVILATPAAENTDPDLAPY